jgi:homoserine/homoserine lactone efflux protein
VPIDVLLAFAAAALAVVLIPGPTVLLVSSHAFAHGLRPALLCILGVCLGDLAAMSLSFLGLGAVLAASASLFLVLKWLGAAYLLYLGLQLWRAADTPLHAAEPVRRSAGRIVLRAFLVNVLHPKGLAFYVAFLPQFLDPARPVLPQMASLMAVFCAIAFSVLLGYALTATRFRSAFARPNALRVFNRTGAACLFGASGYTAMLQRGG